MNASTSLADRVAERLAEEIRAGRWPVGIRGMREALVTRDLAVAAGGDGVEEALAFHRTIAEASGNPVMGATVRYLGEVLRAGIRVTRANEARRTDFIEEVRTEHARI